MAAGWKLNDKWPKQIPIFYYGDQTDISYLCLPSASQAEAFWGAATVNNFRAKTRAHNICLSLLFIMEAIVQYSTRPYRIAD